MIRRLLEAVTTDAAPGGSAPATTTESAPAESSAADFDFAGLATYDDAGSEESSVGEAAKPVPASQDSAATPAPPSALPTAAPTAQAAQPSPQPAESTPPQPPATTTATPPTATEAAKAPEEPFDFAKHREEFVPKLAELYKLSDDEVEAFRTNPGETLPKFAANLHYQVQAAVFNSVLQALPQVLDTAFNQRRAVDEADNAFYTRWPKLKNNQYSETVVNSIRAYRAANPNAKMDKVIEQAGLMAMISLGLNPQEVVAAATPSVTPPPAPRPAGIGAAGHVVPIAPAGGEEENIFTALAEAQLRGEI